jgi:hypothetical protein
MSPSAGLVGALTHERPYKPLASCLAILRYPSPAAYSFKTVSKCSVGMLLGRPGTRVVVI